jgi:hypothetical protein
VEEEGGLLVCAFCLNHFFGLNYGGGGDDDGGAE